MKKIVLAIMLLASTALAADDSKSFSSDTQIKLLKVQRQIQQLQIQIADLQRQFDQATNNIKHLQAQLESECSTAAKALNVDLSKYNCDLDQLTFVPKSEKK